MLTRRQFSTALLSAAAAPAALAADSPSASPDALHVMTYNLRYASDKGPTRWPVRRPLMAELLRSHQPDLIGTQEGLYPQLKDIATDLPQFAWIGLGRDGGSHGEFMAVFYRRDRLEPLEFEHFWLSDTPDVMGSTTWGNSNRRMVTWVRFEDRRTRRIFQFWNTHFDHENENARQKSAALVSQRIARVPDATPVILGGDFNAVSGASRTYEILTRDAGLTDTWHAAEKRTEADANSFNDFKPLVRTSQRIDWILHRGAARVLSAGVVTDRFQDVWPSDHCPVTARILLA